MILLNPKDTVKRYIEEHPAPAKGLAIDIVYYSDRVALRLYRDNFNMIPDGKQQDMVVWLEKTLADLNHENETVYVVEMEGMTT